MELWNRKTTVFFLNILLNKFLFKLPVELFSKYRHKHVKLRKCRLPIKQLYRSHCMYIVYTPGISLQKNLDI